MTSQVSLLPDYCLLEEVDRLARIERLASVELIVALAEVDRRRLYAPAGYSSLFAYCTQRLRLSEGAAYSRIEAARASQRFPSVLPALSDGAITLSTIGLIARHLTSDNCPAVLDAVRHKSKREVEIIVAGLAPRPDVPTIVRRMPASRVAGAGNEVGSRPSGASAASSLMPGTMVGPGVARGVAADAERSLRAGATGQTPVEPPPATRPVIAPLAPERFKLQVTMSRETHDTLREIQDLIRHAVPSGDAAEIVARALRLLRDDLLRRKAALVRRPRRPSGVRVDVGETVHAGVLAHTVHAVDSVNAADQVHAVDPPSVEMDMPPPSRDIPADVKREVWMRDDARCAFAGTDGRCRSRTRLEFHHVHPFAAGGRADAANIELRCRVHNGYEAEVFFGKRFGQWGLRDCKGGASENERISDADATH